MLTLVVLYVGTIIGIISLGFLAKTEEVFFLKPNGRLILLTKVACSGSTLCSKTRRANGYFNKIKFKPHTFTTETEKEYDENIMGFT